MIFEPVILIQYQVSEQAFDRHARLHGCLNHKLMDQAHEQHCDLYLGNQGFKENVAYNSNARVSCHQTL